MGRNEEWHSQAGEQRERWRCEQATNGKDEGWTHTLVSAERDDSVSRPCTGSMRGSTYMLASAERDGGVSRP